jgi:hypothetical protein
MEGAVALVGELSPQPKENQQEETPRQRERETDREKDIASTTLGRKGTVIHR